MIGRYTRPEMGKIFSLENKYSIWKDIEVLACEAQAELGKIGITHKEAAWIRAHAAFDCDEIDAIEATTNHDVIAFLTNMGEHIDRDADRHSSKPSRWVHYGMTSSDLGDTALCYQLTQATDLLIRSVRKLGDICLRRAKEERFTLCVGRTHGVHAEPMTFGMKFGSWAWEMRRTLDRLVAARSAIAVGKISGAVGTYSSIDPFVESYVCERLGLTCDPLSTQIVARDRHAELAAALAITAASLERIATEIRALQKTDTLEVEEPFRSGQKGSSAMPHKRNPIMSERVCGMARVVKANVQVALDDIALWHERDISHSSAERIALVDSFTALDYMLNCLINIVGGLTLYPEVMRANLDRCRGLIFSSKVLLALVDAGMSREEAYQIVQTHSMQVWSDIQHARDGATLKERLSQDAANLSNTIPLDSIFDHEAFLQRVDVVFDRLEKLSFDETSSDETSSRGGCQRSDCQKETGPTGPTDPADPANPTSPTSPTDPVNPAGPANPTGPTSPTNPSGSPGSSVVEE